MKGTITIYVVGGGSFTLEDWSHQAFMEFKDQMEHGQALFLVIASRHIAVNAANVITIEWEVR